MKEPKVYPLAKLICPENIILGNNTIIDDFVFIGRGEKTVVGAYVHIATFASITGG